MSGTGIEALTHARRGAISLVSCCDLLSVLYSATAGPPSARHGRELLWVRP